METVSVLSSEEYPTFMLQHLHNLYKTGTVCDVTLVADDDDTCFNVHSVILMCSSSYFRLMSSVHNHYTIKNVDGGCLGVLVEFMYTGKLHLTSSMAPRLYTTACHLKVQQAVDLCQHYLLDNFSPATPIPTLYQPTPAAVGVMQSSIEDVTQLSSMESVTQASVESITQISMEGVMQPAVGGVTPTSIEDITQAAVEGVTQPSIESVSQYSIEGVTQASVEVVTPSSMEGVAQSSMDGGDSSLASVQQAEVSLFKEEIGEDDDEENVTEEDLTSPLSIVLSAKYLDTTPSFPPSVSSTTVKKREKRAIDSATAAALVLPPNSVLPKSRIAQYIGYDTTQTPTAAAVKSEKQIVDLKKESIDTEVKKMKYKCKKCKKRCASALQLMYHRHSHFQTERIRRMAQNRRVFRALNLRDNLSVFGSKLNEETGKTSAVHKCKVCGLQFTTRTLYRKHFNCCHVKCSKCPSCLKLFPCDSLALHLARRHRKSVPDEPTERRKCRLCQQPFLHAFSLHNHRHSTLNRKEPGVYRCSEARCGFQSRGALSRLVEHMESTHPEVVRRCHHRGCSFTAPVQQLIQRHSEKSHGGMKYCELCDKQFRHNSTYNTHMFTKHRIVAGGVKQVLRCGEKDCDYECVLTSLLEQHRRKHEAGKQHQCHECGRKLKTDKSLEKHMNKVHLGIRPYVCHQCGLTYGEESELKTHMARHADTKPFQCHLCSYGTFDKATYKSHMYSLHDVAVDENMCILQCPKCSFTSAVRSRYNDHMRVHADLRDIACPHCSKLFITKKALRGHVMKVHAPKTQRCAACGYASGSISKLREHIRVRHTHRHLKPYQCSYCTFASATAGNCRKHIMQRHRGQEVRYVKLLDKLPQPEIIVAEPEQEQDIARMLENSELVVEGAGDDQLFVVA